LTGLRKVKRPTQLDVMAVLKKKTPYHIHVCRNTIAKDFKALGFARGGMRAKRKKKIRDLHQHPFSAPATVVGDRAGGHQ
jgi:hypothetical protein